MSVNKIDSSAIVPSFENPVSENLGTIEKANMAAATCLRVCSQTHNSQIEEKGNSIQEGQVSIYKDRFDYDALEADPPILSTALNGKKSPLIPALFEGDASEVKAILDELEKKGIPLSEHEKWCKRAYENDLDFSNGAFHSLTAKMKNQLYRIAHAFNNIEFIARLNQLGMALPKVDTSGRSFGFISIDMNSVEAQDAIQAYFAVLCSEGRIWTRSEFSQWNRENQYRVIYKRQIEETKEKAWIDKGEDFSRIVGRDKIIAATKKLNTKHIKTAREIVVVPDGSTLMNVSLDLECASRNGTLVNVSRTANLKLENCTIYSEKVEEVSRKISREEMEELIAVIQEVGYGDLHDFNFVVGKDGVYFVDTERKSFSSAWEEIWDLRPLLDEKDHDWFNDLIVRKTEVEKLYQKPLDETVKNQRIKVAKKGGYFSLTGKEFKIRLTAAS